MLCAHNRTPLKLLLVPIDITQFGQVDQLSHLLLLSNHWITKEEFEENGAEIVHRKCV